MSQIMPMLLSRLRAGHQLLMPRAAQAGYWQRRVAGALDVEQRGVIATPNIMGWDGWLSALLTSLVLHGRLPAPVRLTPLQESAMWSQVLTQSGELESADPMAVATSVRRAVRLAQDYLITPSDLMQSDTVLATWTTAMLAACRDHDCAAPAPLEAYLLNQTEWILPAEMQRTVTLIDFPPPTPLRARLLRRLGNQGMRIESIQSTGTPETTAVLRCADHTEATYLAMAQARQRLRDGAATVCIAVLDPDADAAKLSRIAAAMMDDGAALQDRLPTAHRNGLLGCADVLIECLGGAAPAGHWQTLLTSPFLGHADRYAESRARLVRAMQRQRRADWDLDALTGLPAADATHRRHELLAALQAAQTALFDRQATSLRRPGQWAAGITAALKHVGWPNQQALTETEWQHAEAVREALSALASLDDLLPPLTWLQAKGWWLHAARNAPPPATHGGRLTLMAAHDLPLHRFDHVVALNAQAGRWPAEALPDPWIPMALQRRFHLPGCHPDRDQAQRQWQLGQWLATAPHWLAICAHRQGDMDLELPADLAAWPSQTVAPPLPAADEPAPLSSQEDDQGLPVRTERGRRGGTALLREQAQCPFRAYAHRRLAATGMEEAAPGLDARDRGELAHEALAALWTQVGDAQALRAMDANRLHDTVADAVAQALDRHPETMTAALRGIERQRLERLLTAWLAMECKRPDFEVISTELPVVLSLGDLSLRGRIDRIDRVGDVTVLIDYKTTRGDLRRDSWLGERPDDPQLPAYLIAAQPAATDPEPTAAEQPLTAVHADGIAFARVVGGRCEFVGLAVDETLINGVKTPPTALARSGDTRDWLTHRQAWTTTLHALADEFVQGHAAVAPKAGNTTCRLCDLHSLCRIRG